MIVGAIAAIDHGIRCRAWQIMAAGPRDMLLLACLSELDVLFSFSGPSMLDLPRSQSGLSA